MTERRDTTEDDLAFVRRMYADPATTPGPHQKVIPMKRRGGNGWQSTMTRGERGPHATVSNTIIVLVNDVVVAGIVAYDEFAHRVIVTRSVPAIDVSAAELQGPYPRAVTDSDVTALEGYVQRNYGMKISQNVTVQAVVYVAETNRVHPVRDWLDSLKWDGIPRVGDWLHIAFGCPKDDYHRAVGTKLLCAAVRRVRHPGCKFDHVLVLEGKQGRGKSRACAALFGMDWFTDNLPHDVNNKDAQQGMAGKWGLEMAELNSVMRSTVQSLKAFFSRQTDYFRPPYGKNFIERPRQCVFIGTTNDAEYLTDETGNRRFWPVFCEFARVEWINEFRAQLWAEACVLEAVGEPLWLHDETVEAVAVTQQANRVAPDIWTVAVEKYIEDKRIVQTADILENGLMLAHVQQNKAAEMRVGKVLDVHGWMKHRYWSPSLQRAVVSWFAPGEMLPGKNGARVPFLTTSGDHEPP